MQKVTGRGEFIRKLSGSFSEVFQSSMKWILDMVLAEVQDLTAHSNPAVTDKINAEMVIFSS